MTYISTCKNDELRYWILVSGKAKNAYNFGSAVITVLSASGGKLDGKC